MTPRKKSHLNTARKRILKKIFLTALALIIIASMGVIYFFYSLVEELPSIASLKDYRPSIITRVYADNNELIDEFYLEDRKVVRVTELPKFLIFAFVAAEDARFFQHGGFDLKSIARAFVKNLKAGKIVQGGSTITQQVAKSLFLTPEKSYIRKLKEAILAYRIDKYLKKYEILNLYMNQIYLGHGAYGIEAAAQRYFGKQAKDLTISEATLLAGLPKAPSRYSPVHHSRRARTRQVYVLGRMHEDGHITEKEKVEALGMPLVLKSSEEKEKVAPYFTENVRRYIQAKYSSEVLYKEGLEVYTTLDIEMQRAARKAVDRGLRELDKRQGYRGVLKKIIEEEFESFLKSAEFELEKHPLEKGSILKALVVDVNSNEKTVSLRIGPHRGIMTLKDMSWARVPNPNVAYNTVKVKNPADVLKTGDVILVKIKEIIKPEELSEEEETKKELEFTAALEQEPEAQSALLCMEARTGEIKAMVGGRSYKKSEFNRSTQARRQPGSAFKPLIYTAAFDQGMTPSTVVMDTPIIFEDTLKDSTWKPRNYEEKFYGPTILRTALVKSRNLVTIKVLKDIGVDYAADYATNMGITSPLTRDLSMALGSSGVTLLEMVRGYGVFANNGKKAEPYFIRKIVDRTGHIVEEHKPRVEQVIDPRIAYITSHLLQEVVKRGTGWRVKALGRPVAGKTGTTNDLKDAWFAGFTPSLVTGVWVGFDDLSKLGKYETGSRAASPIFLYFMKGALTGTPVELFSPPDGVVFAKIDSQTGLLAKPDSKEYVFQCYLEGTSPTEYASEAENDKKKEFFKYDLDSLMRSEKEEQLE
ncbi:MAG: PBP1A family penicillin-binding protein [Thermodesulfobacteriota bacterium]|nr:PBP1A family penicillin-binding protein [Thermodesulfobacteriota bacterium]